MSDAAFGQTIIERWNEAVLDIMNDARYSRWKSDIAEVQAILSGGWSFYDMLRPLLAVIDTRLSWDGGRPIREARSIWPLNDELRDRFLAVLTDMRNDERFRLFYIELDEYLECIGEEEFLAYS